MMPPHYRIECVKPEPIPDPHSRLGAVITGRPYWRVVRIADGGNRTVVARKPTWASAWDALVGAQRQDAGESYSIAFIQAAWVLTQRWRRVGWAGSNDLVIQMLISAMRSLMEERKVRARGFAARKEYVGVTR